jgi:cytochrome c553
MRRSLRRSDQNLDHQADQPIAYSLPLSRRRRPTHWTSAQRMAALFLTFCTVLLLGDVATMAATFEAELQLCASCHGRRGGVPSDHSVPIIWGQQAAYLARQLNEYRSGDRDSQIMSSIAESLNDGDLLRISDYFGNAKWPAPSMAVLPSQPAAIATCRACHGEDLSGSTSASGTAPRLAGQFSGYLFETMAAYANGERTGSAQMTSLMQGLPSANRRAIADYLAQMR